MLSELWARITGRRRTTAAVRAQEFEQMSPEEKAVASESVDDRAAELESEAHFGDFGADSEPEHE